ncbi:MAG TPA: hypothetical protein VIK12_10510 [Pengzhenrongella sp.]
MTRAVVRRGRPHRELLLAVAASLAVFFVHFRPWQAGMLEDWGLALAWDAEGLHGLIARVPATLGRPLHLVPHYVGMVLSDGGFVGPYLVLAVVVVLQFLGARWAVSALGAPKPVAFVLALAIALHPWWPAGDILRFLPAQCAVLGGVLWLGAATRYVRSGGGWWWAGTVVVPALGLLAYQAPAGAIALCAVALALLGEGPVKRRVVMVVSTVASVLAVLMWSIVVAPRLSPGSYEATLGGTSVDVVASLRAIARTVVREAPSLILLGGLIALLVIVLALRGRLPRPAALLLLAGLAITPFAAMIYAAQPLHLNDPERVALPIGLALWLLTCVFARWIPATGRLPLAVAVAAGALAVLGAAFGYSMWTSYAVLQRELLDAVEPVRDQVRSDEELVVLDGSGLYGDVYTFLPPHLNVAVDVELGDGPDVAVCTPARTPRDHPIAARYPLPTTPSCEELLDGVHVRELDAVTIEGRILVLVAAEAP